MPYVGLGDAFYLSKDDIMNMVFTKKGSTFSDLDSSKVAGKYKGYYQSLNKGILVETLVLNKNGNFEYETGNDSSKFKRIGTWSYSKGANPNLVLNSTSYIYQEITYEETKTYEWNIKTNGSISKIVKSSDTTYWLIKQ